MAYLFKFAMNGIAWSIQQAKSRSRGFFMVIACLILPFFDAYLAYYAKDTYSYLTDVPELQINLMPSFLLWTIFGSAIMTVVIAVIGYFAVIAESNFMVRGFCYIKFFQFCTVVALIVCLTINLVRFDNLTGFGVSAYLDDNWPRIMKLIDMV